MAHGVAGLLAVLSLALADVGGGQPAYWLRSRTTRLALWLSAAQFMVDDAPAWPVATGLDCEAEKARVRDAWCYGTPGVARSLWLAGTRLSSSELQATALAGMKGVQARILSHGAPADPTFCHGKAGLLQIFAQFTADAGPTLAGGVTALADELLQEFSPDAPVGYRRRLGGVGVDDAGLLYGAAGVALSLLTLSTDVPSRWDRAFLVS